MARSLASISSRMVTLPLRPHANGCSKNSGSLLEPCLGLRFRGLSLATGIAVRSLLLLAVLPVILLSLRIIDPKIFNPLVFVGFFSWQSEGQRLALAVCQHCALAQAFRVYSRALSLGVYVGFTVGLYIGYMQRVT